MSLQEQYVLLKKRQNGLGIFQHPMCNPERKNDIFLWYVMIEDCVVCGQNFPFHDIIFAHCRHAYHPWCLLSHFRVSSSCGESSSSLMMSPSWLKSFGVMELAMHMFEKDVLEAEENTRVDVIAKRESIVRSLCPELGKSFCMLHVVFVQNDELKLELF